MKDKAGKALGKDAKRGKLTYPGLLGLAESPAPGGRTFSRSRGGTGSIGTECKSASGTDKSGLWT